MMIPRAFCAGLIASALALGFNGDGFAEKFDALPKAVRDTATAHMENAFPVSITSAQSGDGWNYQINTRLDGKYHDLVIDDKGKLVVVKDETDLASVPGPVKSALQKQAQASQIVTLEKLTEGSRISYGALIRDDAQGTVVQLRVGADGTVQSKNDPTK